MSGIKWKLALALTVAMPALYGQFSSGSTGADGALSFTTPGTIDFDPVVLGINAAGDNIFNFTTINIASGVTVKLRASKVRNTSVVWLATGAVAIAGTLDLSGFSGNAGNGMHEQSEPGPGGYAGGVGGRPGSLPAAGAGPGGGASGGSSNSGCGAAHGINGGCNNVPYGNALLVPLRGGSGGGGGAQLTNNPGGVGGAGGGAILIASSGTITVSGSILADGGAGGAGNGGLYGGGGSGGAIHLQSQTFTGAGLIRANGGGSITYNQAGGYSSAGVIGRIRIDATTNSFAGTITPAASFGTPFNTPLPATAPSVRLVSINNVAVPATPGGSFVSPDVTINASTAVSINIAAANVPLGTVVNLYLASETGTDQAIACAPLAGSVASSTATCSATFPLGTTATLARAVW